MPIVQNSETVSFRPRSSQQGPPIHHELEDYQWSDFPNLDAVVTMATTSEFLI